MRCTAMTSTPMLMIVQCDFPKHPGGRHQASIITPMGEMGVVWEDRPREEEQWPGTA